MYTQNVVVYIYSLKDVLSIGVYNICCIHVVLSPDIVVYTKDVWSIVVYIYSLKDVLSIVVYNICCIHVLCDDIVVYTKDVWSIVVYNYSLKDVFTTSQKKRIYI